ELLTSVSNVMHRSPRNPHDVVLLRLEYDAAGQLPLETPGEHDPPLVEISMPVWSIACAGRTRDQRHELALVGDEAARPRGRPHLRDYIGDASVEHVGPGLIGDVGRRWSGGEAADDDGRRR